MVVGIRDTSDRPNCDPTVAPPFHGGVVRCLGITPKTSHLYQDMNDKYILYCIGWTLLFLVFLPSVERSRLCEKGCILGTRGRRRKERRTRRMHSSAKVKKKKKNKSSFPEREAGEVYMYHAQVCLEHFRQPITPPTLPYRYRTAFDSPRSTAQ